MTIPMRLCDLRASALLGLLCLGLGSLMGCESLTFPGDRPSPPLVSDPPASPPVPNPSPPPLVSNPKPVTFSFNVDSPISDLKVKVGDFIKKGQTIADLAKQRLDLTTEKRTLESALKALTQTGSIALSTQREEEAVALAQTQVDAAQAALRDYEQASPWTDFARENLPLSKKEENELGLLKKNLNQAQNLLARAEAKLSQKQAAISDFQQDQLSEQGRTQQQLSIVEQKLAALKPIQSNVTGTITKIDFSKAPAVGQPLKVTVTVVPGETPQPLAPPTGLPSGAPILPNETLNSAPNGVVPEINGVPPSGINGVPSSGAARDLLSPPMDGSIDGLNSSPVPNSVGE